MKRRRACRLITGWLLTCCLAVSMVSAVPASEYARTETAETSEVSVQTFDTEDEEDDSFDTSSDITSPAGVEASVKTRRKITITWSQVLEASSYAVFGRREGSDSWTLIKTGISYKKNTYIYTSSSAVLTLYPGETYEFTVVAFDEDQNMSLFGTDSAQIASVTVAPVSKVTLVSAKNVNYNRNQITWKKLSGADGYRIYRKTSGGKYKYIGRVTSAKTTSYTDKTAKVGMTYYYTVCAYWETDGYEGVGSYNKSGLKVKTKLKKPTLKKLTLLSSSDAIRLSWSKTAGATGYIVYRKAAGGSWVRVASISGKANVTYVDRSAEKGIKYQYKVKAYRMRSGTAYYSAYSNVRAKKIAAASANTASE